MYRIRPWLHVGSYRETLDKPLLDAVNIGAMLQLADRVEQPNIVTLYLPVEDGEPLPLDLLRAGVAFIRREKAAGRTVLVACGAGISRSSTFALAALKEEEGLDLLAALYEVCRNHPFASPHPELWESLCSYYRENIPIRQMLDEMDAARRNV